MVETLMVPLRSPPVPQVSTSRPASSVGAPPPARMRASMAATRPGHLLDRLALATQSEDEGGDLGGRGVAFQHLGQGRAGVDGIEILRRRPDVPSTAGQPPRSSSVTSDGAALERPGHVETRRPRIRPDQGGRRSGRTTTPADDPPTFRARWPRPTPRRSPGWLSAHSRHACCTGHRRRWPWRPPPPRRRPDRRCPGRRRGRPLAGARRETLVSFASIFNGPLQRMRAAQPASRGLRSLAEREPACLPRTGWEGPRPGRLGRPRPRTASRALMAG